MAIDRSKYKNAGAALINAQEKEVAAKVGSKKGSRAGYLKINEGKNMFRIFPPHLEGGGESFAEAKSTTFLPVIIEEKDDKGNVIMEGGQPKTKEVKKSVFNARIHGNAPKDLVEEYVRIGADWADKHTFNADAAEDKAARKKFKDHLYGNFNANPRVDGLRYQHNWVMYAKDLNAAKDGFGILEVKPSVKDRINKIINLEASNEVIGTEGNNPFTPPDEGRALIIVYNKKAEKSSDYYTTDIDSTTERVQYEGRMLPVQKTYPLTDEELEMLEGYPSLYKMFKTSFKRRDFELQFSGLELYDQKYNLGIFNLPEFVEVIEMLDAFFPEEDAAATEDADVLDAEKQKIDPLASEEEETEEEATTEQTRDQDEFDLMSRDELKQFNKNNKVGMLIKPASLDEDIRTRMREWKAATSGEEEETADTTPAIPDEPKAEEKKAEETKVENPKAEEKKADEGGAAPVSAADKLAAFKARQGKK